MDIKKIAENYIPLISFIVFLSILSYLFFLRPPIILVSDVYVHEIYGEHEERMRNFASSFSVFRQIKVIRVPEDVDSYSMAEIIQRNNASPFCVFFPFRYQEIAEIYRDEITQNGNKTTKIFVMANKEKVPSHAERIIYTVSDAERDYYRAGYCAAILSRDEGALNNAQRNSERYIAFIYDRDINDRGKSAFEDGLLAGGFSGKSRFSFNQESLRPNDLACVVVDGPADLFFQSPTDVPVILFTWLENEDYFPNNIKIRIDDSPYTLICRTLKLPKKSLIDGAVLKIPADFHILKKTLDNKKLINELSARRVIG
ncbi:MAG: hypothetical protein LBV68_02050 [Spirochaetaceae bacterium]|jgi:hypothetical protein|nr:hypothetical protein [Spirochaetaceae bacterium]